MYGIEEADTKTCEIMKSSIGERQFQLVCRNYGHLNPSPEEIEKQKIKAKKKKVSSIITNIRTGFRQMITEKSEEIMNSTKSMKSDGSQNKNKSGGYHQNCSQKGSPKSPFQNKLNVDFAPLHINPKQMGPGQDILLSQIQPNSPVTQISLFQESA